MRLGGVGVHSQGRGQRRSGAARLGADGGAPSGLAGDVAALVCLVRNICAKDARGVLLSLGTAVHSTYIQHTYTIDPVDSLIALEPCRLEDPSP